MALDATFFSFQTAASGTADISVSSFGFAPSVGHCLVLLWGTAASADATNTQGGSLAVGLATSATDYRAAAWSSRDSAAGSTSSKSILRNNAALTLYGTDFVEKGRVTLKSLDANGLTFAVGAAFDATYVIHGLCLSGSDLDIIAVGTGTITAASGSESITGLSALPTGLLVIHAGYLATTINTTTAAGVGGIGVGAYDGTRQVSWALGTGAAGTVNNHAMVRTDRGLCAPRTDSTAERLNLQFTSFDDNGGGNFGFTYTITRATGTDAMLYAYVALKGALTFRADSFLTQSSGTGTYNALSSLPTQFKALFTFTSNLATASQTSGSANAAGSIGGATASAAQGASWSLAPAAAQDTACRMESGKVTLNYSRTGADTFAIDGDSALDSFGASTVVLNQTDADTAQHLVPCVLFAAAPAAGGDVLIQGMQQLERGLVMQTASRLGGVMEG